MKKIFFTLIVIGILFVSFNFYKTKKINDLNNEFLSLTNENGYYDDNTKIVEEKGDTFIIFLIDKTKEKNISYFDNFFIDWYLNSIVKDKNINLEKYETDYNTVIKTLDKLKNK